MRFLSVSTPGSLSITVGTQGELHGFTAQLLEDHPANLHVRSVKLGPATIVVAKVGELDAIVAAMRSPPTSANATAGSGAAAAIATADDADGSRRAGHFDCREPQGVWRQAVASALRSMSAAKTSSVDPRAAAPDADGMDDDTSCAEETTRGPSQNMFVVVGSDEGYSEVTLLRVACLLSELCVFLCIEPHGGPNAAVLKQVMMYVEQRLSLRDVSFLTQAIEHLMKPAIVATGFTTDPTALLDDLVRQNLFAPHYRNSSPTGDGEYLRSASMGPIDEERVPGYAAVMFGHKLVLETSTQLSDESTRVNGLTERFVMTEADRYLIHLITSAHFAMPMPQSYHDIASDEEKRIRVLEYRLRRFGIHRHNVSRHASRRLIEKYCRMLRRTDDEDDDDEEDAASRAAPEHERANFFEDAFNELQFIMCHFPERVRVVATEQPATVARDAESPGALPSRAAVPPPPDGELFYTNNRATYFPSMAGRTVTRNQYHDLSVRYEELEDSVFSLHNLCFRNADFTGSMQLVWIPTVDSATLHAPLHDGSSDGEGTAPPGTSDSITNLCPYGYGMALVYLPPMTERDAGNLPPRMTREDVVYNGLAQEVLGSMEVSFNCFQWLLSPPVESYETPGLIHFVVVDRMRGSRCISGSVYRMMHQKPLEVQFAVLELRQVFSQCVSRAHELLSAGYSEGLWGHIGMQFFYSVGMYSAAGATAMATAPEPVAVGSGTAERGRPDGMDSTRRVAGRESAARGSAVGRAHLSDLPLFTKQAGIAMSDSQATPLANQRTIELLPASSPLDVPVAGVKSSPGCTSGGSGPLYRAPQAQSPSQASLSPSLYGPLDKKCIPSAALPHLALRPTLIPDTLSERTEKARLVEVYAMFLGSMSPEEVCGHVQQLLAVKVF